MISYRFMEDKSPNYDKVIFTISFLALLLPLSSYKNELDKIQLNLILFSVSIYKLCLIMALILFISVYLSGVYNLKHTILGINWKILNYCNLLADVLYAVAILVFPSGIIFLYISSKVGSYILEGSDINESIVNSIINILTIFIFLVIFIIMLHNFKISIEVLKESKKLVEDSKKE